MWLADRVIVEYEADVPLNGFTVSLSETASTGPPPFTVIEVSGNSCAPRMPARLSPHPGLVLRVACGRRPCPRTPSS
eukprot:scaffold1279_cov306-Prasinococcus_capsulatus_cf.AAC.3